ncbi:glycoside hydrolase [Amylocystis lapponica]|nr:glycoside hydrolase [Amylocystis lapponica]
MFSTSPSRILSSAALVALAAVGVLSAPSFDIDVREVASRATNITIPAAPRFVIYSDEESGLPDPKKVKHGQGYNVFALSFLLASGSSDQAQTWEQMKASDRSRLKAEYVSAGINVIVSAFGETEKPTTDGEDPVAVAKKMAAWVKKFDMDGIDVDYEDFDAIDKSDGAAEKWVSDFTTALRKDLPQGQYILTHAPIAPWFSKNDEFTAGAYHTVDKNVGDLIDWYNVQFYNRVNSLDAYRGFKGVHHVRHAAEQVGGDYPNSALFQIAAAGIDVNKLLIGKPANSGDADDGFIDPKTLAGCVEQAKNKNWNAGVMVWEFPDAAASWIQTVRSQAFPM